MDGFSMAFPMLTSAEGQRFIRDCKAAGKGLMTWTVNEKRDMRMAKKWGIDWLITDRVGFSVDARTEVRDGVWESGKSVRAADRLTDS
jgi:phosphatidylglycerol phospholipase C